MLHLRDVRIRAIFAYAALTIFPIESPAIDEIAKIDNDLTAMLESKQFDFYRESEKVLNKARTRKGKKGLFSEYQKDFALRESIPEKNRKLDSYRRLLWKVFLKHLAYHKICVAQGVLDKEHFENVHAKEAYQNNPRAIFVLNLSEQQYARNMSALNIKRLDILKIMAEVENEILTTYGPQVKE
jgi:hypothetical protein